MLYLIRWAVCIIGLMIFSLGMALTINMQHLGIHPWEVLSVRLYEIYGFSVGTWNIVIGLILVIVSLIIDKSYIKFGSLINIFLVGIFVDFYLSLEFLPGAGLLYIDLLVMIIGIVLMGFGGGMYNAGGVGSGPRDGFMLSISDKLSMPIRRVRVFTESTVLMIGLILGGPVFIFTFIFTFIQSPIFQFSYLLFNRFVIRISKKVSSTRIRNNHTG